MDAYNRDERDENWTREPSLDDLLDDPIMLAFLARDHLSVDAVRTIAADVGSRLVA